MILLPIVRVSSTREAREALGREEVQGVLYDMPPPSDLLATLRGYQVPFMTAIGPVRYTPTQPDRLRPVFREHLERLHLSGGSAVEGILATLHLFAEILGGARPLECKIRFQRPESVGSRPHYDPSALTLLRTLLGPGTWLLPQGMEKMQVPPLQVSIHKGSGYPGLASAKMLHDYPTPDDPAMTDQGRIVLIASSRHGV